MERALRVMAAEVPLDTPEFTSTWTSLRFAGAHIAVYHMYVSSAEPQVLDLSNKKQASKAHKKHLESLPSTTYPLAPTNDPAQVRLPTSPSMKGEIQGDFPQLAGEQEAGSINGQPLQQR